MPHINPRGNPYPFSPLAKECYTENGKRQHFPYCVTQGSPIPRRGHKGIHPIGGGFMSPFLIVLNFGQQAHTARGRTLRGRWGFVPYIMYYCQKEG